MPSSTRSRAVKRQTGRKSAHPYLLRSVSRETMAEAVQNQQDDVASTVRLNALEDSLNDLNDRFTTLSEDVVQSLMIRLPQLFQQQCGGGGQNNAKMSVVVNGGGGQLVDPNAVV